MWLHKIWCRVKNLNFGNNVNRSFAQPRTFSHILEKEIGGFVGYVVRSGTKTANIANSFKVQHVDFWISFCLQLFSKWARTVKRWKINVSRVVIIKNKKIKIRYIYKNRSPMVRLQTHVWLRIILKLGTFSTSILITWRKVWKSLKARFRWLMFVFSRITEGEKYKTTHHRSMRFWAGAWV